jgi:hypothetical protein
VEQLEAVRASVSPAAATSVTRWFRIGVVFAAV